MTFRPIFIAALLALPLSPGHTGESVASRGDGQSIGLQGSLPNFAKVQITSPHVYDYTFSSAPTDWRVQSGTWEMTNRWDCSPGWSWFGGSSNEIAAIWNKRKFSGDVSVQFYFGFKMGVAGIGAGQKGDWWNRTKLWGIPLGRRRDHRRRRPGPFQGL